jgi:hypothetical protein
MWHLVDVLELSACGEKNPVGHCTIGILLAQSEHNGASSDVWPDVRHPKVILQVVACLRIGAKAIRIAVIENLPVKPVIDKIVEPGIRCAYFQAAKAELQKLLVGVPLRLEFFRPKVFVP